MIMKMFTKTRAIIATASLAGAVAFGGLAVAAPANAYVGNCTLGYNIGGHIGAYAYCSQGDSATYQVRVLCKNKFTKNSRWVSGPWVKRGGQTPSTVSSCAWNEAFYGTPYAQGS